MKALKVTIIAFAVVVVLVLAYLAYQSHVSRAGKAVGLINGKLAACPGKPNCVCSEYPQHADSAIEPISMRGESASDALQRLRSIIEAQGGSIDVIREDYIAASFSSSLFGFVDDLEIRVDPGSRVIHLRSASRVGTSDLGANSRRIHMIKKSFGENQ
jgi:uncharacterized protein (DUF1499 family)